MDFFHKKFVIIDWEIKIMSYIIYNLSKNAIF